MVGGPSAAILEAIRSPTSLEQQIAALRQLKNDIVGHDQRKEQVVRQGIVQPLVDILANAHKATGKRRADESNGVEGHASAASRILEEEANLEATLILGTLAAGGRAFVAPLLAANAPKRLLESLSGDISPRTMTAALQAIHNLAVSARCECDPADSIPLGLHMYDGGAQPSIPALQHSNARASAHLRTKLSIDIVSATATNHESRAHMASAGVLESLAAFLAAHAVQQEHFIYNGPADVFPPPPPVGAVPSILSAITAITSGSNFRVQSFLLCQPIRVLFSHAIPYHSTGSYPSNRTGSQSVNEALLPQMHVPSSKSVSFAQQSHAWPAMKSLQQSGGRQPELGSGVNMQSADLDHANAVCGWLMYLARSLRGTDRLMALRLLGLVNNAVTASSDVGRSRGEAAHGARIREKQLALLAVPLAVDLIQAASEDPGTGTPAEKRTRRELKEQACSVLALLVRDSKELQAVAVEAGAIKRICPLLKKSFDSVPTCKPMWPSSFSNADQSHRPESCRLGDRGLPPEIVHAMRCRQGALEALAALSKKEDVHRKAIIEAGVVQCFIDSLKLFPSAPSIMSRTPITPKDGNSRPVLLAACSAAKSMSRSVSALRTSLIDGGIAKPIFLLVQTHQDLEVKIAATDVLCNLVLDVSPMRDEIVSLGAIKTLCEHTRQSDLGLRLSSLWALKHLILEAASEMRMQCLEELGAGWLAGAIQGDHDPDVAFAASGGVNVSVGLSAPNAAGEQVNLLNPASMDLDDVDGAGDDDSGSDSASDSYDEDGEVMYDKDSGTQCRSSQIRSTLPRMRGPTTLFSTERYLSCMREMEQDPELLAKRMDVAVQEQALDFVRNLILGPDHVAAMVDHVLQQIGSEKLFALLTDKLARLSHPTSAASNGTASQTTTTTQRPLYNSTPLILSTLHVLTHMANGAPRHKSLLIAQTPLLRAWLPHFTHPDRRVRVSCVWIVTNLIYIADETDREDAKKRARELRVVGIDEAVRALQKDPDLDVRERVVTCVRQLDSL